MRRLLFIEARAFVHAGAQPVAHGTARARHRAKRLVTFDPDHPQNWRVTFRLMDRRRPRRHVPAKAAKGALKPTVLDAWPLALRCEALLRAFNDPIPHARRLARRLAGQSAPRAPSALHIRTVGGGELWSQAQALCASVAVPRIEAADSS